MQSRFSPNSLLPEMSISVLAGSHTHSHSHCNYPQGQLPHPVEFKILKRMHRRGQNIKTFAREKAQNEKVRVK